MDKAGLVLVVVFAANYCLAGKIPWHMKLAGLRKHSGAKESNKDSENFLNQLMINELNITKTESGSPNQDTITSRQKRVVPEVVAEVGTDIIKDLAKQAVDKQLQIIDEQQKKAEEFVNKKLKLNIEPNKGWKTESMFVPAGVHIDAEYSNNDKGQTRHGGAQPFIYPMGVGGVLMNGCYGRDYQKGDPCYAAKRMSTKCLDLIDGAAFIGVGFDGRSDYSPESRKMSIIQRVCAGKASYDDADVPDTMNVHGVYDTTTSMHSFYSRSEYQKYLQQQAGMSGSYFGFYGGVKAAWGSSTLSASERYMSLLSIDIDRYEIYLDEVKPGDLSVNFLQEFMDLPTSYLAPGASVKFQNFILRWGTHYIKSGKFGGRLQIFKTMEADQVSSKEEFSQVMEAGYKSMFSSINTKYESKAGTSEKKEAKTSSTSISVEGGDQQIAAVITDFNSPTIKYDLTQWLASIRTYPKPFKFMVAPIIDLVKFNPSSLFPDEKRDWGCEAHVANMKEDSQTKQHYYEVVVNGTVVRHYCPYKDRDDLVTLIERRRNGLERAVGVYMEEGPISTSDITLPAGLPGCETKNYKFQHNSPKPSWDEITKYETHFLVIFNIRKELEGTYEGPVKISPHTEKFARFYDGEWFVGDSREQMDLTSGCSYGNGEDNKICLLGLVLSYNAQNGFLTLSKEDFNVSKESFPSLTTNIIGSLIAHVEWPSDYIFQLDEVVGYMPCNVKWSNVLRFDPSNQDGKCLHFSASSKGTIFVIFAAVPNNKDTWYYVQISPYGVGIFKSQRLMVSTIDVNAVGLGADILYQSYFVCLHETSQSTVIEYGKSQGTTENGDVYLTMIDRDDPLFVRFYSFGNGEEPLEVVDAHIISRHLTKANCKGGTVLDNQTNMCVQHCHPLCDPTQGCRGSSGEKPLPTNCNACQYAKNVVTGECLKECPQGWDKQEDNTCRNLHPCNSVQCLNGGTCRNLEDGNFKCDCAGGVAGQYCEGNACSLNPCLNGATCINLLPDGKYSCSCGTIWKGKRCDEMKSNGLELSTIVGSKTQFLGNLTSFLSPVVREGYHWALCWRASKDGESPETFHSLCDGKGPTVSIVKVGEYIFGGYTNASWSRTFTNDGACKATYDPKAFIFSLVNSENWGPTKLEQTGYYSSRHSESTLGCDYNGPTFGGGADFSIGNMDAAASESHERVGYTYGPPDLYNQPVSQRLLAGSFYFKPDDVETFYETT